MRTVHISGFGGSYEYGCQLMLHLGMAWLNKNPDFDFDEYEMYPGIVGVTSTVGDKAKELDKVLLHGHPALEANGVTGAMHQAVLQHLAYIHEHGHLAWLVEMSGRPEEDFFEFDGTEDSCPPAIHDFPQRPLAKRMCACGHNLPAHAMTMEELMQKLSEGIESLTSPCRTQGCDCPGYRNQVH